MRTPFLLWFACLLVPATALSESFLVRDGKAEAVIVIGEKPPRMVALAASELQHYVERITGVALPIVVDPKPGQGETFRVYVGKSAGTEALGVNDEGLAFGAYRMRRGPQHLVLLGQDYDYQPKEPAAGSRKDAARAQAEWDRLTADRTDAAWPFPMASVYRGYNRPTETWIHDEGGSLNAVYGLLRRWGVRWYAPGELGELVPERSELMVPSIEGEVVVRPDYALRQYLGPAWFNAPREAVMWYRRLGMNGGIELLGIGPKTHGLGRVLGRPEMEEAHPEYYAMINGERQVEGEGSGHACWSSRGLEKEVAAYARAVFDIYDEPTLQLSPADGLRMCRCEDCSLLTPSDAVWGFLDRVAQQVAETHPDKLLVGAAYTSYRTPPENLDALSPNIAVRINNVGRPAFRDPEHWQWYEALVDEWRSKARSGKIIRVENNYLDTVIHPRQYARDLTAMKGVSLGEMNEVSSQDAEGGVGKSWGRPGINHLNLYVNARFLWDADQDIDDVLEAYYRDFYGPASEGMKAAFEYAQAHYSTEGRAHLDLAERVRLLELLHEARVQTGDSRYGKRIDWAISEFDSLETLRLRLSKETERPEVPGYSPWNLASGKWDEVRKTMKVDGKLDEAFWRNFRVLATAGSSGKDTSIPRTRFQILLDRGALWLGVHCEGAPVAGSKEKGQAGESNAILQGERLEFRLETDAHSHYRIVVSPKGAVWDEDAAEGSQEGRRWSANAEIATQVGAESWSLEARLPLVPESEGAGDPLHHLLYRRPPSGLWPWYFNVVRARPNEEGEAVSAFAGAAEGKFFEARHFARMARK